jgi:ribosomal protein S18 acetylase RimI-like enzyme
MRTASGPQDARAIHAVSNAAFADHFDSTPLPFGRWLEFMTGPTHDPGQWTVVEHEGAIVGFAIGSNRYAEGSAGYIASLAVLREHRGRGLATALLHARFADDARLGRRATLLHCDSENTTGATRIYEQVGMRVDQEVVAFHRPLVLPAQRRDAGGEQPDVRHAGSGEDGPEGPVA